MEDDGSVPPLPRRAPGDSGWAMPEPVRAVTLPERVVQRILAALDAAEKQPPAQDHAAPAETTVQAPAAPPPAPDSTEPPAPDPAASPPPPDSADLSAPDPRISAEAPAPGCVSPPEPAAPPHAASSGRPGLLPQRVPGASDAHKPPGKVAPPVLRAALPHFWSHEVTTPPAAPEQQVTPPAAPEQTQPPQGRPPQTQPPQDRPPQTPPRQAPPRQAPPRQAPPRQISSPQRLQRRTRRRRAVTSAVIVVVALAGLMALMLSRHAPAAAGSGKRAGGDETAIREQAAAWVAGQVSRTATVACDPLMCRALEARGIPAASLLELRPGAANPLLASVIVDSPQVRGLLGGSYLGRYAPAAIAGFGSENAGISIRVIAPRGAASYLSALHADVAARKAWAGALLQSKNIVMPAAARTLVADGRVDPRLLVDLASLVSRRQVSIVAFGDGAPGATPGVALLRSVEVSGAGNASDRSPAAQVRWISRYLHGQQGDYLPASVRKVSLPAGGPGLRIQFTAPSPLGLLKSTATRP
jgi:hypothetical protein